MNNEPDMAAGPNSDAELFPPEQLRVLRIIAGALIFSLASLLLIVLLIFGGMHRNKPQANTELPIISLVSLPLFIVDMLLFIILPAMLTKQGLKAIITGKWQEPSPNRPHPPATIAAYLQGLLLSNTIIAFAILNGVGFFACIAYMLEGRWYTPCMAVVILVIMAINFPTASRARNWMVERAEQLQQLRDSA